MTPAPEWVPKERSGYERVTRREQVHSSHRAAYEPRPGEGAKSPAFRGGAQAAWKCQAEKGKFRQEGGLGPDCRLRERERERTWSKQGASQPADCMSMAEGTLEDKLRNSCTRTNNKDQKI